MKKLLISALLFAAPLAYSADKVIFACTDNQGKQVRVTEHSGKFRYQFGKPDKPELVFENKRAEAVARSPKWNGLGDMVWSMLMLENGNYHYGLYRGVNRKLDVNSLALKVYVWHKNGHEKNFVNAVDCNMKRKVVDNLPDEVLFIVN